jgi:crotonobetainyl-CoA:carnitine CoA-transferase CaiB-like acyl-CoA transferase
MSRAAQNVALPLAGLVMVELGSSVAAPFGAQIFADLGATVLKVETKEGGDDARSWGPPFWHGAGAAFQTLNRNKLSAALDLKNIAERDALVRFIIERADCVLQNMRPGLVDKLGLDAQTLRAAKPALIYCNLGAFGSKGPMRQHPGYDPLIQAFAGLMSVTGEEGRPPVRVVPSIIDMTTGMWSVIGMLSALRQRDATGEGCTIDTSLFETGLSWMNFSVANYLASGKVPRRTGTEAAMLVPYKAYQASDGYMVIAAGNDSLFRRLVDALGHPEWATDARFKTNPDRVHHREAINQLIDKAIATQPRAHWTALLERAGVPCGPLQTTDEVVTHPQTEAVEMLQTTPDGKMRFVGVPIRFDGQRPDIRKGPPTLGEHTGEVLR